MSQEQPRSADPEHGGPGEPGNGREAPVTPNPLAPARGASALTILALPVNIATQFVLPPVLLARWGDLGYAFCVAVQGFASYVSVADAGVLLYLSRHLAVLRAAGDEKAALALTRGGLRAFGVLACAGAAVVFLAFLLSGRRIWGTLALSVGITPAMALAAA